MVKDFFTKKEFIYYFCDTITSFVSILEYVEEYVLLHQDDGDFGELLESLNNFKEIYLKHFQGYQDELNDETVEGLEE